MQLNVDLGVTTGATADGSVVTAFHAQVSNQITNPALSPDGTALYRRGQFTSADRTTVVSVSVVYVGGHNRWVNNYSGNNSVCEPTAMLVDDLAALDAGTGLGLP